MKELWNAIQLAIATIGAWLGYLLGGLDGALYALVCFVVIDYLTGVFAAVVERKLSSAIGFKGIFKKMLIIDNSTSFKCLSWSNLVHYINLEGDFFPCCHGVNSKYVIGNLFESDMDEILNSEKMKEFKKGALCLNHCNIFDDCCKLHELR